MKTTASSLERLESRIAPANIVCTVVKHVLQITGDGGDNIVQLDGNADPTTFLVTSSSDTINGASGATGFTTPTGVTSIVVKMGAGGDFLNISDSIAAIHLTGSLSIDGGDGSNRIDSINLTVDKSITIQNGDSGPGLHQTTLNNTNTGGSLTIKSTGGNGTQTFLERTTAGNSTIGGKLTLTNGAGSDFLLLADTNVGGNVTVKNGHGDALGSAGVVEIFNSFNPAARSVIKGNVAISFIDGDVNELRLSDYVIRGNASFNTGSGSSATHIDGAQTNLPVVVRGNFALKGTGAITLDVGLKYSHDGLVVGKALTVAGGDDGDSLTFNQLQVDGSTKFTLGDGENLTRIDDSIFVGKVKLTSGNDRDEIEIETTPSLGLPTFFESAVSLSTGAEVDDGEFAGLGSGELIYAYSTLAFHHGPGFDTATTTDGHIIFPFGGRLQFVT